MRAGVAADIPILDDSIVAAVHRQLRAGGLGEQRSAHFRGELGDITTLDLDLEHLVGFVIGNRQALMFSARCKHIRGPDRGVEYRVRMQRIDTNAVRAPFQRGDASELC